MMIDRETWDSDESFESMYAQSERKKAARARRYETLHPKRQARVQDAPERMPASQRRPSLLDPASWDADEQLELGGER